MGLKLMAKLVILRWKMAKRTGVSGGAAKSAKFGVCTNYQFLPGSQKSEGREEGARAIG